ncbi:DUF3040 domain-containing protein [Paractinoplanes rishiriensis]|uniref:DUF3040 domain-containing protein n=1 Tax=Paractinoplanes rishiriensis TaxID=1050105 RepID=A0A919K6U2_9ACTN|nr:DUF3040 domain-containing protein [Actinoplanes rishiriensis]GIF01144.1 hypothetical protein Ari01nite_86080 [Actinoplanes rishiriensis]
MLSEAEQRQLAEIERGLRTQDPSFARRISGAGPGRSPVRRYKLSSVGWLAAATLAACLAILFSSGWIAVIALTAACLSMGAWAAEGDSRR